MAALADPTTGRVELDIRPTVQKCEAVRLVVSETQPGSGGRGFELVGVNLDVAIKPGAFKRLPAAARQ